MVLLANVHVASLISLYAPAYMITVLPFANVDVAIGFDKLAKAMKCIVEKEARV